MVGGTKNHFYTVFAHFLITKKNYSLPHILLPFSKKRLGGGLKFTLSIHHEVVFLLHSM